MRVIELADWVAGPFATSVLGDFGAEVIRVDLPGKVVNTRTLHGLEEADAERSPFFAIFAHNKKSVEIDIRIQAGREIFLDLIRHSDVLVSGFRPGVLAEPTSICSSFGPCRPLQCPSGPPATEEAKIWQWYVTSPFTFASPAPPSVAAARGDVLKGIGKGD